MLRGVVRNVRVTQTAVLEAFLNSGPSQKNMSVQAGEMHCQSKNANGVELVKRFSAKRAQNQGTPGNAFGKDFLDLPL